MTKREAAQKWVREFNAIPQSVVVKLMEHSDYNDFNEITPQSIGDMVSVWDEGGFYYEAEIINRSDDDHLIVRDEDGEEHEVYKYDATVEDRYDMLPMWGTMWSFGDSIDDDWLNGEFGNNGLQLMADCGFRIYESEDWGYVFGLDAAGFDFYEAFWIPLYDARGLKWHDKEE